MRAPDLAPSLIWLLTFFLCGILSPAWAYDPMALSLGESSVHYLELEDPSRKRVIPVKVYLPARHDGPQPVVIFSHGLGGARESSPFLGDHWSARGYVTVVPQHVGSDESVWKDVPEGQRLESLVAAANVTNYLLRVQDILLLLDHLGLWQDEAGHLLEKRLDLEKVGMSGHSFGALTTQALAGQALQMGLSVKDSRIKAALVMSPSTPPFGEPSEVFAQATIPWMLMTGTEDELKLRGQRIPGLDRESRRGVFPALPAGGKYELVLAGAKHFVFTERPEFDGEAPRSRVHQKNIVALSTAFWDAWLKGDAEAKAWLDGDGPRALLDEADAWQRK